MTYQNLKKSFYGGLYKFFNTKNPVITLMYHTVIMDFLAEHPGKKYTYAEIAGFTGIEGNKDKLATVRGRISDLYCNGFVERSMKISEVAFYTTKKLVEKYKEYVANKKTHKELPPMQVTI